MKSNRHSLPVMKNLFNCIDISLIRCLVSEQIIIHRGSIPFICGGSLG
jgi:hypothetical protein